MEFKLAHDNGELIVHVTVDGKTHTKDVTAYFLQENPHDDWLDYRIHAKYLAKTSKLTPSSTENPSSN